MDLSSDITKNTRLSDNNLSLISSEMESKSAEELLGWAMDYFAPRVALASSFGAEDVVLIHLMCGVNRANARIFTLDTGRLNQETYDLIDEIQMKYGIRVETFFPESSDVEQMVRSKGMNLMYDSIKNRKLCCNVRKVKPLERALKDLDCWITGIRREQSITRNRIQKVEIDTMHNNMLKINPLADWKSDQVWKFIKENDIPYNKLHDVGYSSIGCAPCTRAVQPGEDPRSGRWWWEVSSNKECGLHWEPAHRSEKKDE